MVVSCRGKEASGREVREDVEMDMSCSLSDSMRLSSVVGDTVEEAVVVVVEVSFVAMLGVGSREVTTLVEVTLRVTT